MINVCIRCGVYRADKLIDPAGPFAICPECNHKHRFKRAPLFLIGGASGTGKTAVYHHIYGTIDSMVPLEADILWMPAFAKPEEDYRDFFETWLRVCKNISQAGRPVALFGAGFGVPANLERCVERRYFSTLHYLALVCDEQILITRLKSRPAWRNASEAAFINSQISFNQWFLERASNTTPPVHLLDTSSTRVDDTASLVINWLEENLHTASDR